LNARRQLWVCLPSSRSLCSRTASRRCLACSSLLSLPSTILLSSASPRSLPLEARLASQPPSHCTGPASQISVRISSSATREAIL
jgi:hypothetical protein